MAPNSLSRIQRSTGHKVHGNLVKFGDSLCTQEGDNVDLHRLLTENNPSVFLMPILGNVMRASGLFHGGIAVIHKTKRPFHGAIVAVRYNGMSIIRKLLKKSGAWVLVSDDPREEEYVISENDLVEKIGVVTASIIFQKGQP